MVGTVFVMAIETGTKTSAAVESVTGTPTGLILDSRSSGEKLVLRVLRGRMVTFLKWVSELEALERIVLIDQDGSPVEGPRLLGEVIDDLVISLVAVFEFSVSWVERARDEFREVIGADWDHLASPFLRRSIRNSTSLL